MDGKEPAAKRYCCKRQHKERFTAIPFDYVAEEMSEGWQAPYEAMNSKVSNLPVKSGTNEMFLDWLFSGDLHALHWMNSTPSQAGPA